MSEFKILRCKLGYSQLELSVAAGVSPVMIVAIERYNYIPGPDVRAKLALVLGMAEGAIWPKQQEVTSDRHE